MKVTRFPGADVKYSTPPVEAGLEPAVWAADPGQPGKFFFRVGSAEFARWISLEQWQTRLRDKFPERAVTDRKGAAALQLSSFVQKLLTVAEGLNARGWRLGLVHPKSIWIDESDARRVLLPDLGFAWMGTVEPAKPDWLRNEDADRDWWAGEVRGQRQLAAPEHLKKHPHHGDAAWLAASDTKAVARILQYLLTGSPKGEVPALAAKCPVWQAIRKVDTGEIATPAALRKALGEGFNLPLDTGTGVIPPPPPPWPPRWLFVAGLAALVLLAAGLGLWWRFGPEPVPVTSEQVPTSIPTKPNPPVTKSTGGPIEIDPPKDDDSIEQRARKAIKIAETNPLDPRVAEARTALQAELEKLWKLSVSEKKHVPLQTLTLMDLLKQLPKPTPEIPR